MSEAIDVKTLHSMIQTAFKTRDFAYARSKFKVGAALLTREGVIFGGCNVENRSSGATICAERTAIVKAVSEGYLDFSAVVVVSLLQEPSVSPCGICRQNMREFMADTTPVFMVGASYPWNEDLAPQYLADSDSEEYKKQIVVMTLGQLYPMSFGPVLSVPV